MSPTRKCLDCETLLEGLHHTTVRCGSCQSTRRKQRDREGYYHRQGRELPSEPPVCQKCGKVTGRKHFARYCQPCTDAVGKATQKKARDKHRENARKGNGKPAYKGIQVEGIAPVDGAFSNVIPAVLAGQPSMVVLAAPDPYREMLEASLRVTGADMVRLSMDERQAVFSLWEAVMRQRSLEEQESAS